MYTMLVRVRAFVVGAINTAGTERCAIARAIWTGAVVSFVGPVSLDLPVRAVEEGDVGSSERPGAIVAVLVAAGRIPGIAIRVGARFRKLVPGDVGEGSQTLRLSRDGALRIAAGIAVQVEKESELNGSAVAGPVAMVSAVVCAAAFAVHVDRVVSVCHRSIADHLADFRENRRCAQVARQRSCVHHVPAIGGRGRNPVPTAVGVLVHRGCVSCARTTAHGADVGVPLVHASDFVAGVSAPTGAPEDRLNGDAGQDGAAVVEQIIGRIRGMARLGFLAGPVRAEYGWFTFVGVAVGSLSVQKGWKQQKQNYKPVHRPPHLKAREYTTAET